MPPPNMLRSDHMSVAVVLVWAFTSFLSWSLLYYLCVLAARGSEFLLECMTCCLRALHATLVIVLSATAINEHPHPFLDSGEDNIPLHNFVLIFSLGFFLLECALALLVKPEPKLMMAHHYMSVIVLGTSALVQHGGAEMMAGMFFMESTNPLFQARQILRLTKYKNGLFYKIVEWTFVLLFTFIRIFPTGIITLLAFFDPHTSLHVRFTFIVFYFISLIMVYFTLAYAIKKYFKKTKQF